MVATTLYPYMLPRMLRSEFTAVHFRHLKQLADDAVHGPYLLNNLQPPQA
jgi:hypothetical protein